MYSVGAAAKTSGLEDALRRDIRESLVVTLDDQIINGSGTAPEFTGLLSALTAVAEGANNAVANWGALVSLGTDGIDGLYAYMLSDVRLLLGLASYKLLHTTWRAAAADQNVSEHFNQHGVMHRASSRLDKITQTHPCLLYTSPSPRDRQKSRMPSSA